MVSFDKKALETKALELTFVAKLAVEQHSPSGDVVAAATMGAFAELSPPTEPELLAQLIVLSVARQPRAESRKPGNIYLNWRKLVDIVPDGVLAAAGAATGPSWLIPFAGLYIWNKVRRGSEEQLTDIEATVVLGLWKSRDANNKVSEDVGFARTNSVRRDYALPELSRFSYEEALTRLAKMQCLELKDGQIWLREWIRVSYS